jgi:hypothetical protein
VKFKHGTIEAHKTVRDSWGEHAYLLWVEDSFSPAVFYVRGDSFGDAYEWFLCDPLVEAWLRVEDSYEDYIEGWDPQWVRGIGNTNKATLEDLGKAYEDGRTHSVEWTDNGVLVDAERVNGVALAPYGARD